MLSRPAKTPPGTVLVHIGPAKTGSTAIQHAMFHVREQLAKHGVHYVGSRPHEEEAGRFVLGRTRGAIGRPAPRPESWQRLVDEIAGTVLPRVVLSNEALGRADATAIDRVVSATGAGRTHLVYVARRLDKVLPSHWQQQVKARMLTSYEDFLREMLDPTVTTSRQALVMAPQDVGAVLGRWRRVLAPEQMTIVVAAEGDRTRLPGAFEDLLGLPRGTIAPPPGPANRSMGFVATEVVRRINRLTIEEEWTEAEYRKLVQVGVVPALKRYAPDGVRLSGVPVWAFDRVAELADQNVTAIASSGATVVGDPESLRLRDSVEPVDLPDEMSEISLDLLAEVVSGIHQGVKRMRSARSSHVAELHDQLSGRQLLQLLARRTAARLDAVASRASPRRTPRRPARRRARR